MHKDLKWKIPLILALVLGAAWLAWPLKEKISLGLDLQGGMHLVLEVKVEEAVKSSLERFADDIKSIFFIIIIGIQPIYNIARS